MQSTLSLLLYFVIYYGALVWSDGGNHVIFAGAGLLGVGLMLFVYNKFTSKRGFSIWQLLVLMTIAALVLGVVAWKGDGSNL
jgi:hypothetical protein